MGVKISWTGASAVPNSEDTAGVQICANSGVNAEALSLKLVLTMALKITKIHLKRFTNYDKKVLTKYESICQIRTKSYKFDRDSNQECRSVPRQSCEQVQRGMQCHQVILQFFARSFRLSSNSMHGLPPHSFARPKIWFNPVLQNYPLMLPKNSNLCFHNTQKETEECKPLLQQKCHQVRNMLVGVWSKRFNGTKVQILTKYTNTHQMCKYSPNGRCSPNVQKHTKCTNAYQMC